MYQFPEEQKVLLQCQELSIAYNHLSNKLITTIPDYDVKELELKFRPQQVVSFEETIHHLNHINEDQFNKMHKFTKYVDANEDKANIQPKVIQQGLQRIKELKEENQLNNKSNFFLQELCNNSNPKFESVRVALLYIDDHNFHEYMEFEKQIKNTHLDSKKLILGQFQGQKALLDKNPYLNSSQYESQHSLTSFVMHMTVFDSVSSQKNQELVISIDNTWQEVVEKIKCNVLETELLTRKALSLNPVFIVDNQIIADHKDVPYDCQLKHIGLNQQIKDTIIRIGEPQLFKHLSKCVHLISFSQVRSENPQLKQLSMQKYPYDIYERAVEFRKCQACKLSPANWFIVITKQTPSQLFLCSDCKVLFCNNEDGKPKFEYLEYPYIHHS